MYHLMIRSFIVVRTPLKSLGSLKSLKFLSISSENKQNTVMAFFENHGFSNSQISVILKKVPQLLSAKPENSLLPKLLFFQSKGLSSLEVVKLVSRYPYILKRSLSKHIIPSSHYFQNLLQTEENTIVAIKRSVDLLYVDLRSTVRPNIEILRHIGVPDSNIQTILRCQPRLFISNPFPFKETVEEVKEMGFSPLRITFLVAVAALQGMSQSTWKKKVEVYRKWGCPKEQVLSAFRRHPGCMMASEDKINGVMDYFVNQIGCQFSFIARNPAFVTLSLKGRIVPRGSVYLVLVSEGLIKKHAKLRLFFSSTEKFFLENFIKPNEKCIPGLLKLYKEKLEVSKSKEV